MTRPQNLPGEQMILLQSQMFLSTVNKNIDINSESVVIIFSRSQ